MGMSASQVRFLSLQNRKNTIGHELMTLSNRKLALSRDMNNVANNYTNALNQIKLKWSPDGGINYHNLTYDLLMKPNELNAETPYIVTDKFGRVVVDDNAFTLTNSSGSETYNCKSLKEMAKLISSYSNTTAGGVVEYGNGTGSANISYLDHSGGTVSNTTDMFSETNNTGKPTSDADAYHISRNFGQFNYSDAFRIDLFYQMGLISKEQVEEYDTIMEELYGPPVVKRIGNYDGLLEQFDRDKTLRMTLDDESFGYSDVFGNLTYDSSTKLLDLNGGCAYGNLQLAKAYRDEYKAFLNTTFKRDILVNQQNPIARSSAGSTDAMDLSNFTGVDGFRYNGKDMTGISFRTVDLLSKAGDNEIDISSSTISYNADGLMNHLGLYTYDETHDRYISYTNLYDLIGDMELRHMDDEGDLTDDAEITQFLYDKNNKHSDWTKIDGATLVNWAQIFDHDGVLSPASSGSYDTNGDGYYMGKDYLEEEGATTGISLMWQGDDYDIDGGGDYGSHWLDFNGYRCLEGIINCLGTSAKTIKNINERAVDYATEKTYEFYMRDRITSGDTTADAEERSKYKFGWMAEDEGDDYIAINLTNVIATFWTFYAMYDSVDRELGGAAAEAEITARIHDSVYKENDGTYYRKFTDAVYDAVDAGNGDLAKCVAGMSDLNTALAEYINRYDTNTFSSEHLIGSDTTPGNRTFTYSKPNNDGSISKRIISGEWNGTQFTKVTSVVDKIDDNIVRELNISGSRIKEIQYVRNSGTGYDKKNIVEYAQGTKLDDDHDFRGKALVYVYGVTPSDTAGPIIGSDNSTLSDAIAVYNNSGITSMSNLYLGDLYHKFLDDSHLDDYKTDGASFYILKDGSGDVKDANYNYQLDKYSVEKSVFASAIYLKPEDKYSKMLDDLVAKWQQEVDNLERRLENFFTGYQTRMMEFFDALFKRISKNGWAGDDNLDGTQKADDYLNSMLQNNQYYITEAKDIDSSNYYKFTMKQAASCTTIYQVHDSDAEEKALAEYTAKKTAISVQEKKVDRRMKSLETEQEAINTELESVKKVKEENIEKFFKIFA